MSLQDLNMKTQTLNQNKDSKSKGELSNEMTRDSESNRFLSDLQSSDPEAWSKFVIEYSPLLYFLARPMCGGSESDVEDLVEEVWLAAYQAIVGRKINSLKAIKSWMYQRLKWQSIHRKRKLFGRTGNRGREVAMAERDFENVSTYGCPVVAATRKENAELIGRAMNELGELDRTILRLRFFEETQPRKIAILVGLPVREVYRRLEKSKKTVREYLLDAG